MTARVLLLLLIGGVTGLDLLSKAWALHFVGGGIELVPGFLGLVLGFNTGVSFGLLAADGVQGYVVLVVLALAMASLFAGLAWNASSWLERAGYGAIVGGAIGNLLDRLPDGMVTDFLDLHAGGWHFPTFNMADMAIAAGILLLLAGLARRRSATS